MAPHRFCPYGQKPRDGFLKLIWSQLDLAQHQCGFRSWILAQAAECSHIDTALELDQLGDDFGPLKAIGVQLRSVEHELCYRVKPFADGLPDDRVPVSVKDVARVMLGDGDDNLSQGILGDLLLNWTVLQAFSEPALAIGSENHAADSGEGSEIVWQNANPTDLHDLIGIGVRCITKVLAQP